MTLRCFAAQIFVFAPSLSRQKQLFFWHLSCLSKKSSRHATGMRLDVASGKKQNLSRRTQAEFFHPQKTVLEKRQRRRARFNTGGC